MYVKTCLLRFVKNMLDFFCKLHILLNQEHILQDQQAK